MASVEKHRRLIVTADDFGRSSEINQAVREAHQQGILTAASLMVAGDAFAGAVAVANENPRLGVGLHLTLCCGRPVLPANRIPDLVNERGEFGECPVTTGFRYFFKRDARRQLKREIEAQFERFLSTGLKLDHVNGHLHFHLHPTVFEIVRTIMPKFGVRALRLTREPWELDFLRERGRWGYRVSHAAIFHCLSRSAQARISQAELVTTDRVYGLLQDGRVHEDYLLRVIEELPRGTSEVYSHPSAAGAQEELRALTSQRVATALRRRGVELVRYQDL